MKIIYEKAVDILKTVPDLRFIDLDKGQLEIGNTAVAFPCALVNIDIIDCQDVVDKIQRVTARLVIRLGFDYTGQTSAATPDEVRDESLHFFDVAGEVHAAFQGYWDDDIENITRVGSRNEQREDGLKVIQIAFECRFEDRTADF